MDHGMTSDAQPTWRKPAGAFIMIAMIVALCVVVGSWSDQISRLPMLAQVPLYLFLGLVWIAPLGPLLLWMETGKWRR